MHLQRQEQKKLEHVLEAQKTRLLRKANVVGVGIGEKIVDGKRTGRSSVTVFVEKKVDPAQLSASDMVQPLMDGVETDVVESGKVEIQANTARLRPALAGISVGHPNVTAGTLGCLLQSEADGRRYILSNNHVLADMNNAAIGDAILQPGRFDGGVDPADRVARLHRFRRVSATGDNLVDCAIARPDAAATPIVRPVTLDAWSAVRQIPGWFGSENQGGDIALATLRPNGQTDLIVFHIDNPSGENHGYYRIGWSLNADGVVTGGWSDVKPVPGWFGSADQGAGIAVADISGNGRPDLVIFHIDNPNGENHGYYRIGWNLDANGDVTGGWSDIKPVPGWFGSENQGAGIALADIDGNGRPEMFILHLDNPSGENRGYYRIGWSMDTTGNVARWDDPRLIPGWFGSENQGAGIAIADVTGSRRPEMIVYHLDNPAGENIAYVRIGRAIRTDGTVSSWSDIRQVSGWVGSMQQGGGIAAADINGDGVAELVSFFVDNPSGENHGYYRVAFNLGRSGDFVSSLQGFAAAGLGTRVWKSGRTTELTNGSVTTIGATFTVGDGAGGTFGRFVDQLVIRPAISKGGDSGSIVVNAQNRAVGLLFAGSPEITIVNRIEHVLEGLRWSDLNAVPGWFGSEDQGADVAVADLNGNGRPDLIVFHIDNPGGENHGYYRIGRDLDGNGSVAGWSDIKAVPGWFGSQDQGAGIAVAHINGGGRPDLVVFHVDNPGGENHGYYRIGWNLNAAGDVESWSDIKAVPGWFGSETQGAAIAIADISGNGRPDLVVFHIDNPGGENLGHYRIGWNLDASGNVTGGWSEIMPVPGWFGSENQGAGIAIADLSGTGRPDLVVYHTDNPGGENHGYYRVGSNLDTSGIVRSGWSPLIAVPGWFGSENQGAGIALTRLNDSNRQNLVIFHLDNPSGENHGYYRVAYDLMPTGAPARWSIAQAGPGAVAAAVAATPRDSAATAQRAALEAALAAQAAAAAATEAARAAEAAGSATLERKPGGDGIPHAPRGDGVNGRDIASA